MAWMTLDKLPKKVLAKIDLQTAFMASRCIVAAERFQIFRKLHGKALSVAAIGKKTGIRGWRLEIFLAVLMSLGLLKKKGDLYQNSALAERYFIKERSIYWTRLFSEECLEEYKAFSVLEETLTSGKDYESILGIKRKYYVEQMQENPGWAHDFTNMLFYFHRPDAGALAKNLDLRGYKNLLDVGGGSGVMSMALVQKYKNLRARVFDIEGVVRVTKNIIKREGLSRRMDIRVGDMTKEIPSGFDVIMFCDTGNISKKTMKMAYDSLPEGGLLVLVNNFSSDDLTEPLHMLMWQLRSREFWLSTRHEVINMLREIGFKAVKQRRIFKDVWMITGRK